MARRLFTLLSALSLLLCAATVLLWVRSLGRVDQLVRLSPVHRRVESDRGHLVFVEFLYSSQWLQRHGSPPSDRWEFRSYVLDADDLSTLDDARSIDRYVQNPERFHYDALGFSVGRGVGPMDHMKWVVVPYWFAALAFANAPLCVGLRRFRTRRRKRLGLCRACGHDLRATPGRCPECGTAAAVTAA